LTTGFTPGAKSNVRAAPITGSGIADGVVVRLPSRLVRDDHAGAARRGPGFAIAPAVTRQRLAAITTALTASVGCARPSQMPPGPDWTRYAVEQPDQRGPGRSHWRAEVCARQDLRPDYRVLNEANLVAFLRAQGFELRIERQPVEPSKPELVYVFVADRRAASGSVALRVATLASPDVAGHALYDALLARGEGAWGVHRANVAVLGPAGFVDDDLAFAARTRLACWGTFTFAEAGDAYVVAGGYAEP
jgi:hypothetical protein